MTPKKILGCLFGGPKPGLSQPRRLTRSTLAKQDPDALRRDLSASNPILFEVPKGGALKLETKQYCFFEC